MDNKPRLPIMFKDNAHKNPGNYPDDLLLWQLIKNGERAGMEGLYVKYTQQLFNLGMSIKGDRSFIKDCIHEVFVNIWQYRLSLKETDNVKLYLFKCLSHKIHKEVGKDKKRYGQESLDQYEDLLSVDSVEPDFTHNLIDKKRRSELIAALEKLPIRQKEVIQYLFFENHSYEDISKIMSINVQSVYTLAWKAISSLKKRLVILWACLIWICG